jgi:hypothetical protein
MRSGKSDTIEKQLRAVTHWGQTRANIQNLKFIGMGQIFGQT